RSWRATSRSRPHATFCPKEQTFARKTLARGLSPYIFKQAIPIHLFIQHDFNISESHGWNQRFS
ncbi:hypothetical protein, partial [Bartonella sp. CL34QHWL]|uniref:hypothetical protein n=1 Tax=Bartonella sp. CL34QHWL TaxID=3243526 RepID=UPI0035CF53BC